MHDSRLTPARGDLAAAYLEGKVQADRFVTGEEFEVVAPIAPVREQPSSNAMLMTEALRGERVTVYDRNGEGWAWGQLGGDGYVGWLPDATLMKPAAAPTHKVSALRTLAFPGPSIKLPPVDTLVLGSKLTIAREDGMFRRHARGHVPAEDPSRAARPSRAGLRCGRRALPRHALSLGRQEQFWHRLLRPGPGLADLSRHRLPARQRHAAGRTRPRAGAA